VQEALQQSVRVPALELVLELALAQRLGLVLQVQVSELVPELALVLALE
jgi:hypothetical protein